MNLPPLPELPEAYGWFDIRGEAADGFTADQLRAYALSYGRAVQEACARLCDQVAYDWDEQRPFRRVAEDCAAAIRNGVIREGEGEKTAAPSKRERWICLLCKSSRKGQHGTLDDKVTPCPNGAITRSTG